MERARELVERQDRWCLAAAAARELGDEGEIKALVGSGSRNGDWSANAGGLPDELELKISAAMLRGRICMNVHCCELKDFEDMIRMSTQRFLKAASLRHILLSYPPYHLLETHTEWPRSP